MSDPCSVKILRVDLICPVPCDSPPTRLQRKCNTPFLSSITASHLLPSKHGDGHRFVLVRLARVWLVYGLEAPRAPLGVPIWKPFLKRREMVERDRMRPVPVVFLRLAFSDQLSVCPACQRPVFVPCAFLLCLLVVFPSVSW